MMRTRLLVLTLATLLLPAPVAGATADAELGGRVWADINVDGIRQDSENGVAGIGALLFREGGAEGEDSLIAQMTTDASGAYGFTGLERGDYSVQFLIPEGLFAEELFFTHRDVGDDDGVDSDADPFSGRTTRVRVRDVSIAGVDAGLAGAGGMLLIEGIVWEDRDDNGIRIDDERWMGGVTVNLLREAPGRDRPKRDRKGRKQGNAGSGGQATFEVVNTILSSSGGFAQGLGYEFYILPSKARYAIEVVPPDDHETVLRDQDPSDGRDSDVDPVNRRSDPVVADQDHQLDVGLAPLSSIGDLAWVDGDRDGLQDPAEPGLEDVLVFLERLVTVGDPDDADFVEMFIFDDLKVTDGGGFYGFGRRRPGTYRLRFVPPPDFGFTRFQEGDDGTIDSDARPDSGITPEFALPDDASPPGAAALERIAGAFARAAAERDPGLAGAVPEGTFPVGGGGPLPGSGGSPALYADQWDAGFSLDEGTGIPQSRPTTQPGLRPVICATGKSVKDPEVTVSEMRTYRLPNGDRVFLVKLAKGLTKDYSFAVLLLIRTPQGVISFKWEIHDKVSAIGQFDPNTNQLVRETGGDLQIFHDRAAGIVGFMVEAGVIPEGADAGQARIFHSPTPGSMTRCFGTETFPIP